MSEILIEPLIKANINFYYINKWITLPITKTQLDEEFSLISDIKGFYTTIPGLTSEILENALTSDVNFFADRIQNLEKDFFTKLIAISSTTKRFKTIEQFIDFTFNYQDYILYNDIFNEKELGKMYINDPEMIKACDEVKDCIDEHYFGMCMAREEDGVFTPLGYIVPKNKTWDKTIQKRKVPKHLVISSVLVDDFFEID